MLADNRHIIHPMPLDGLFGRYPKRFEGDEPTEGMIEKVEVFPTVVPQHYENTNSGETSPVGMTTLGEHTV